MKQRTIYLDLDGVICQFVIPACRLHGVNITDLSSYPQDAGWDVVKACNKLRKGLPPLSSRQFWDGLDLNFWETLPMFPGAGEFVVSLIKMCGVENICIATSATLNPQCAAGKVHWIQENLPELDRQYFIGPNKAFLANENTVLIDDRLKNCEDFSRKGRAILVARPWNPLGYLEDVYTPTLESLKWIL